MHKGGHLKLGIPALGVVPLHSNQVAHRFALLLHELACRCDPELGAAMRGCDLPPFFALSWVITWWAHEVPRLQVRA